MRRQRREPEPEGCPLWVVTFGDAMSLLVTFFVMLVSFADFEEHALQNMLGALKGGLRAVPLPLATTVVGCRHQAKEDAEAVVGAGYQGLLQEQSETNIIRSNSADYYLHLLENGVSLVINQSALFEPGTATLSDPSHEVWQLAADLVQSVENELRVAITLPENVVVRHDTYTTPWGLGIEQALVVQTLLAKSNGGDHGQIGTSVRVVKQMDRGVATGGIVEIRCIGSLEWRMKSIPRKILRGLWRELPEIKKEQSHGEED